jgi:DNA-binding NarL/FixJ family response regulator
MADYSVERSADPQARERIGGGEPRLRILLVDDDAGALLKIEQAARDADMDVVATTNNGEHALDLARLLQPDVALIDWDMPHFGGALTARLMTRYAPDVTPVLLRGHEVREADTTGLKARFPTIQKVSDPAALREQLVSFHQQHAVGPRI